MASIWDDYSAVELKGFRKALVKSIASGVMQVDFGDRRVRYQSVADMRRALQDLQQAILAREGTIRVRQVRVNSAKGF